MTEEKEMVEEVEMAEGRRQQLFVEKIKSNQMDQVRETGPSQKTHRKMRKKYFSCDFQYK